MTAQLAGDLRVGAVTRSAAGRAVAGRRLARDQLAQPVCLRVAGRDGEVRQPRRDDVEVERAVGGQLDRPFHHAGVAAQPGGHLRAGAQVAAAGRGQPAVHLIQAEPGPDRGQRLGQPGVLRRGVVHVPGRDHVHAGRRRQRGQRVVALIVGRLVADGELDLDVVRPNASISLLPARAPPPRDRRRRAPRGPRPCGSR